MNWTHDFDRFQCDFGMPSIFTLSHEGEMHLDVKRTRDFYKYNPTWWTTPSNLKGEKNTQQHLIAIDQTTRIPQYLLLSTQSNCHHPQFELISCDDYDLAMEKLQFYRQKAFEEHRKRRESNR